MNRGRKSDYMNSIGSLKEWEEIREKGAIRNLARNFGGVVADGMEENMKKI